MGSRLRLGEFRRYETNIKVTTLISIEDRPIKLNEGSKSISIFRRTRRRAKP